MESEVVKSYSVCHKVLASGPRSATVGVSLLPVRYRDHAAAIFAMCQVLRGWVSDYDAGTVTADEARAGLAFWREWFAEGCWDEIDDPIAPAARYTILANEVPPDLFVSFIRSLEADLDGVQYASLSDLIRYCYQSASAPAIAMCYVAGIDEDRAAHARVAELGVAVGLTGVIRDVGEDIRHNRIHLPLAEMKRERVLDAHLRSRVITRGYCRLIEGLIKVAEAYYAAGLAGLDSLPHESHRAVRAAVTLNQDTLRAVRHNAYDNLTERAATSIPRAGFLMARGLRGRLPTQKYGPIPEGLPDGDALISSEPRPALTALPDAS